MTVLIYKHDADDDHDVHLTIPVKKGIVHLKFNLNNFYLFNNLEETYKTIKLHIEEINTYIEESNNDYSNINLKGAS